MDISELKNILKKQKIVKSQSKLSPIELSINRGIDICLHEIDLYTKAFEDKENELNKYKDIIDQVKGAVDLGYSINFVGSVLNTFGIDTTYKETGSNASNMTERIDYAINQINEIAKGYNENLGLPVCDKESMSSMSEIIQNLLTNHNTTKA